MSLDNVVPEAQVWSCFAGWPSTYGNEKYVESSKPEEAVDSEDCSRFNAVSVVLVALIMVNAPPVPINAVLVTLEAENDTVHQL